MKQIYKLVLLTICLLPGVAAAQIESEDQINADKKTKKAEVADALNSAKADSTRKWRFGVVTSLTFNQTYLSNWSAGGQQSIAFAGVAGLFANYEVKKHYWFNLLDMSYGIAKLDKFPWRKTQDYLEFNTKYGFKFRPKWSLTVFGEAISQFAYGYDYNVDPEGKSRTSSFFAPGYVMEGVGITFQDNKIGLSARIAPLTARHKLVLDDAVDETVYGLDSGAIVRHEFGASLRINYLKSFWKDRITLDSRLLVFYNYLQDQDQAMVNWRTKLDIKLLKVLSINLLVHLIYDPNVLFPDRTSTAPDGTVTTLTEKRALQVLQTLGVGIGYTFVR